MAYLLKAIAALLLLYISVHIQSDQEYYHRSSNWVANSARILLRHRDFEVPQVLQYALGQYGPNVSTSNRDKWARHRRIVSSVIDERISKAVFDESIHQTSGLLEEAFLRSGGKPGFTETSPLFDMLKKISVHVLLSPGMGIKVPRRTEEEQSPEPGYKMTHVEPLTTVVASIVGAVILPTVFSCFGRRGSQDTAK
ncbi:hypothetical protein F4779DRAFT_639665 [Xylariaceae sp. FL0662B]|nr:hypothetical protein F4779DRAFT_639665 [Xylariaceae sp. FL0662B]